jgi:hypothetical protein
MPRHFPEEMAEAKSHPPGNMLYYSRKTFH